MTGTWNSQMFGKTLSLDVFMRVFPSEISIWICRQWSPLSSPAWPGHIQSTKGLNRIKSWVENNYLSLLACLQTGTLVFFCLQTWTYIISLLVFVLSSRNLLKFLMSDKHTPFLGLLLFYLFSVYLFTALFFIVI